MDCADLINRGETERCFWKIWNRLDFFFNNFLKEEKLDFEYVIFAELSLAKMEIN